MIQTEFTGIQIGALRFSEHTDSILARRNARDKGKPEPEKYFAIYGCGLWGKRDKRTMTLSQLQSQFGPATHYGL